MVTRGGELHPLENTLVLNHIFQRCSLEDLKSCRLVSRLWRDSSRLAWRSSAKVRIYRPSQMRDFLIFSKEYGLGQGQTQITEVPFTNFLLFLRIEDSRRFYNFWGSSIKSLSLQSVKFQSGKIFVETIFNRCPNLEELDLFHVTVTDVDTNGIGNTKTKGTRKVLDQIKWNEIQENKKLKLIYLHTVDFSWADTTWTEFLSRLPSLQNVTLEESFYNCEQFFRSLKTIRERDPDKLNLKLVDIGELHVISPAISTVLLDANLHLHSLRLGSNFLRELGDSVPGILNQHASSLKEVILLGDSDDNVSRGVKFTRLQQLKSLEIFINYYRGQEYPLMMFLKLSPNLKNVQFWSQSAKHLGVENLDVSETQGVSLKWCTELYLLVPNLKLQHLEHLISWMPNLKKLRIQGLNNEMFSMVCEGWSKLVKLEVAGCTITDSGISGLDVEDVRRINRTGLRGVWRPTTVPRANISCLKELETFSLRADPLGRINRGLGYCAVAYGIELVPNLKHLNIQNFHMKGRAGNFWRNVCSRYPWPEDDDSMEELVEKGTCGCTQGAGTLQVAS